MKTKIEVKDKQEAKYLRFGMADAQTRALVLTMGALLSVPDRRSRTRILTFVIDKLDHQIVTDQ